MYNRYNSTNIVYNTDEKYNTIFDNKKVKGINQYTTLTVPSSANETVIPFSNRVKSAKGNILFDMTNPNIYKSIAPIAIAVFSMSLFI